MAWLPGYDAAWVHDSLVIRCDRCWKTGLLGMGGITNYRRTVTSTTAHAGGLSGRAQALVAKQWWINLHGREDGDHFDIRKSSESDGWTIVYTSEVKGDWEEWDPDEEYDYIPDSITNYERIADGETEERRTNVSTGEVYVRDIETAVFIRHYRDGYEEAMVEAQNKSSDYPMANVEVTRVEGVDWYDVTISFELQGQWEKEQEQ